MISARRSPSCNQSYGNEWGVHLVTPLVIAGTDQAILVDRGWIPHQDYQDGNWSQYAEPGMVAVTGVLRRPQTRAEIGGRTDPTPAPGEAPRAAWNFVNIDQISKQVNHPLLGAYVQQAPDPAWTALPYRTQPELDLTEGPHRAMPSNGSPSRCCSGSVIPFSSASKNSAPAGGSAKPPPTIEARIEFIQHIWSHFMIENSRIENPHENPPPSASETIALPLRYLVLASAILVFLLIVVGGIVSATGSGGACPDWPTCLGSWAPPAELGARLDYAHRILTILSTALILASAWLAWRRAPQAASRLVQRRLRYCPGSDGRPGHPGLGGLTVAGYEELGVSITPGVFPVDPGSDDYCRGRRVLPRCHANAGRRLSFRSPFARLSSGEFGGVLSPAGQRRGGQEQRGSRSLHRLAIVQPGFASLPSRRAGSASHIV